MASINDNHTKIVFSLIYPQNSILSDSTDNQLGLATRFSTKFGIEILDMCGHVTGNLIFLNYFLAQISA